jgi:hypothetical protein
MNSSNRIKISQNKNQKYITAYIHIPWKEEKKQDSFQRVEN